MPFASAYQSNKNKVRDIRGFAPTKHSFYEHTNNMKARDSSETTLYLQRANGNPVIQGLIGSDTSFDFRNVIIQPKLKISHPDDVYEQEADRTAEQVMSLPSLPSESHAQLSTTSIDERVGRKCSACRIKEKEEEIKMGLQISRKSPTSNNVETSEELAEEINQIRTSNGTPLDTNTRQFMESAFEYDFSAVRLHTDKRSARSAESIYASAYTTGNDIIFSEGMYMPSTADGRRLLSHELAHVIQQGAAGNLVQRPGLARSASMKRSARMNKTQAAGLVQLRFGLPALQRKADIAQAPPDLPCNAFVTEAGHIPGTDVFFGISSSTLPASKKADIAAFVSGWVADGSKDDVQVDGFASVDGPQALNWRLSCERAEVVKAELIVQGVPAAMITTVAHGESDEFSTTTLEPNRRAIITKQTSLEATAAPTPTKPRLEEVPPVPAGGGTKAKGVAGKDSICKDLCGKGKVPLFGLVSKHGGTFAVCSLDQKFDQTKPAARPFLTPGMVLKDIPATDIEFTTNSLVPTWQFQAGVTACLPESVPDDDWDYGFIQSVESLRFNAEYTLDWQASRVVAAPSRDANPSDTEKPWINPPGAVSGPVKFGKHAAMLVDRPGAKFPMFVGVPGIFSGTIPPGMHKTAKVTPCASIRSVGCEGVFNIWLVVKRSGFDELAFLSNTQLSLSQLVKRDMAKDPDDSTAWAIASSGGSMDKMSGGKGPKDPVLETFNANKFLRFLMVFMGKPCPIRL